MKNTLFKKAKSIFYTFLFVGMIIFTEKAEASQEPILVEMYDLHCATSSDINEHLPVLRSLAMECSSVTEIGVRSIVSTWGILQGLSENSSLERKYLGIDLQYPDQGRLQLAKKLAEDNGINFSFWAANDMEIEIEPVDMLFIDSLHTYCHLTNELEMFSPVVRKYLCFHDTSEPWGDRDDDQYRGDYSEYPTSFDCTKRGLWAAVSDFLDRHPEWSLVERRTNNHGFTILKRNAEMQ